MCAPLRSGLTFRERARGFPALLAAARRWRRWFPRSDAALLINFFYTPLPSQFASRLRHRQTAYIFGSQKPQPLTAPSSPHPLLHPNLVAPRINACIPNENPTVPPSRITLNADSAIVHLLPTYTLRTSQFLRGRRTTAWRLLLLLLLRNCEGFLLLLLLLLRASCCCWSGEAAAGCDFGRVVALAQLFCDDGD